MKNLFIIGNGFDVAHGLKTTYDHFRDYLINEHPGIKTDELIVPQATHQPNGGVFYEREEILSFVLYLIDEAENNTEQWKNVEAALGRLNFSQVLDWVEPYFDRNGEENSFKTAINHEDAVSELISPTLKIKELFPEWINTISFDNLLPKKNFQMLIAPQDLFLNFNYTETLEIIYNIPEKQVCHIHGKQKEDIFFGHGDNKVQSEECIRHHIGSEGGLTLIDSKLRKRTDIALEQNSEFFSKLCDGDIKKIYSFGFSFSDVDQIYLREICNLVDTDFVVWLFNDFDACNHEKYKQILMSCGYRGSFDKFHLSN